MWWKIYFWILAVLAGLGIMGLVVEIRQGEVSGVASVLIAIIFAIAVYSIAYKKPTFTRGSWRIWLVIALLVELLRLSPVVMAGVVWDPFIFVAMLVGLLIVLPAWYCMYKLGFGKELSRHVAASKSPRKKVKKKSS